MRRLALGAAAGGGAFAFHRLVPRIRALHAHCRALMQTDCARGSGCTGTRCLPE